MSANQNQPSTPSAGGKTENSKKLSPFMRATVRGFLILIPVVGLLYALSQIYGKIQSLVANVMAKTDINSEAKVIAVIVLSILVLIGIAYLVGWLTRYDRIKKYTDRIDEFLIDRVPAYRNFKLQMDNNAQFALEDKPPVFVSFGSYERPGFLMEGPTASGKCVVFLPRNYATYTGNVYIVQEANVHYVKGDKTEFLLALDHCGGGLDLDEGSEV